LDVFTNDYLIKPEQEENEIPEGDRLIPPPNIPVVWAGCRVRSPINMINMTIPYGGYGTFFTKGALKRMMIPLHCNVSSPDNDKKYPHPFEKEACEQLKPGKATIGEGKYYKSGMSLQELMMAYTEKESMFCLHSDWFLAYWANQYNVSRHVIAEPLHPGKKWRFDDLMNDVPHSRLHTLSYKELDDSEYYHAPEGNCAYGDIETCHVHAKVCHRVNSTLMKRVYAAKMNSTLFQF
jgi:hypothetical protein